MASPEVEPPMTSCQCSTGNWLASRVPQRAQRSSKDLEEVVASLSREARVVQAYQRSDLLKRRPQVLQARNDYVT